MRNFIRILIAIFMLLIITLLPVLSAESIVISKKNHNHNNKTSKQHKFPFFLYKKLEELKKSNDPAIRNKILIYQSALKQYKQLNQNPTYTTHRLSDEEAFILSYNKTPPYFQSIFQPKSIISTKTKRFYDYEKIVLSNVSEYWVDFSNRYFGGTPFDKGFVQEEIMIAEMPELANVAAFLTLPNGRSGILTRTNRSKSDQVKEGSPKPIAFKGIRRVQAITGLYGRDLFLIPKEKIRDHIMPLHQVQTINIVAIAAPKLNNSFQQAEIDTIEDLFNSVVAGFSLCKEITQPPKRTLIHTGPIGCGAFKNQARIVYVLQKLAAMHLDIDIAFHGYTKAIVEKGEDDLLQILKLFNSPSNQFHSIQQLLEIAQSVFGQK